MRRTRRAVVQAAVASAVLVGGSVALSPPVSVGAAAAPDGSLIAWISGDDLWVSNPDGTGRVNLTATLAEPVWNEGDIEFTPDRRRVVFGTASGQYSVGLDSGVVTPLPGTDGFSSFGLSPDGDVLGLHDGSGIYTVPVDGSAAPVTVPLGGREADDPEWAPNGDRIAFGTPCCAGMAIYVVNEDGSGSPVLISTGGEVQPRGVTWSPDGTRVAYEAIFPSSGPDQVNNIVVANADGSGGQIGVAPKSASTDNRNPTWSPDGSRIAFTGTTDLGSTTDVFAALADGSSPPVHLSDGPWNWYGLRGEQPWSPDSTRLVYGASSSSDAFVAQADGSGTPVPLPLPAGDGADVSWSPDGTQLAVWVTQPDPAPARTLIAPPPDEQIYVVAADGSGAAVSISAGSGTVVRGPWWSGPLVLFTDVDADDQFYDDIVWMVVNDFAKGDVDGGFNPQANVTRGSMAAFLYRMAGEPAFTPPLEPSFVDVPESHVFFDEIEWLADAGITGGFADDTYGPGLTVTRGSMATFLYRMAGEPAFTPPAEPSFVDVPESHIFFDEIEWLADAGITGGYADDTFRPANAVTRQIMAAFLHRFVDLGLLT